MATESVTLRLDDEFFRKNLKKLGDRELPRAMSKAINRVAFEILDDEKAMVGSALDFYSPQTKGLLAGKKSFFFKGAKPNALEATIEPRRRAESILRIHQTGGTVGPGGALQFEGMRAVPIDTKKIGVKGRVPKAQLPERANDPDSRIFRHKNVILQRVGRQTSRRKRTRVLFALIPSATITPALTFFAVVRDTAAREWVRKAKSEFEKMRFPDR